MPWSKISTKSYTTDVSPKSSTSMGPILGDFFNYIQHSTIKSCPFEYTSREKLKFKITIMFTVHYVLLSHPEPVSARSVQT